MHQSRQFSEHTQEMIDAEVTKILLDASERAIELLVEKREQLDQLKDALIEREELTEKEIEDLVGFSVHGPVSEAYQVPTESIVPT
jgi:cell division protease FtsH